MPRGSDICGTWRVVTPRRMRAGQQYTCCTCGFRRCVQANETREGTYSRVEHIALRAACECYAAIRRRTEAVFTDAGELDPASATGDGSVRSPRGRGASACTRS